MKQKPKAPEQSQLTNKHGFSDMMLEVLTPNPRVACGQSDYSATSLINPPQQVQLTKRNADKIKRDAKDMWAMWLGNAVHYAIEKKLKPNYKTWLVEQKITRHDKDRRVVAIFDAYNRKSNTIYDHKTTTTYIHGGEAKEEWAKQLNINAYFLEAEGHKVDAAKINAIYKDWSEGQLKFKGKDKYPTIPHAEVAVPLLPQKEREKFYLSRLQKHIDAETLKDTELPACTKEEMWESASLYKAKLPGVYTSKRNLPTKEEAEKWIEENQHRFSKKLYIEHTPGTRTRCEKYCDAAPYCQQYQKYLKEKKDA